MEQSKQTFGEGFSLMEVMATIWRDEPDNTNKDVILCGLCGEKECECLTPLRTV